jgi:hypothetical protein
MTLSAVNSSVCPGLTTGFAGNILMGCGGSVIWALALNTHNVSRAAIIADEVTRRGFIGILPKRWADSQSLLFGYRKRRAKDDRRKTGTC